MLLHGPGGKHEDVWTDPRQPEGYGQSSSLNVYEVEGQGGEKTVVRGENEARVKDCLTTIIVGVAVVPLMNTVVVTAVLVSMTPVRSRDVKARERKFVSTMEDAIQS